MVWKFYGKAQFPHSFGWFAGAMQKLCLSRKFPQQEIRWNYSILHSENCHINPLLLVCLNENATLTKLFSQGQSYSKNNLVFLSIAFLDVRH